MINKRLVRQAAMAVALLMAAWAIQEWLRCRPNRTAIIAVIRDLRPGMTRDEVDQVLARHDAKRLERTSSDHGLLLAGQTGLAAHWQLGIVFDDGRLVSAKVWTEDGPYHPSGVPPDIDR
jgi:hypothetical protein